MKIKDILRDDFIVTGDTEKEISGISYDSRNIKVDNIFVAIKGEKFDGHDYIENAINKSVAAIVYQQSAISNQRSAMLINKYPEITWIGVKDSRDALAAVSDNFYGRPSENIIVIGITGTNGKTTTSYLIKSILQKWGHDVGLTGTITYLIKDTAYDAPHTTPESPDYQLLLKKMTDAGCSHVVSEVSSHALAQKRVDYTRFKVTVFTNLTRDHLDFHLTMEDYFKAKERLFTELLSEGGSAVINIDDPYGIRIVNSLKEQIAEGKKIGIITFGIKNQDADIIAHEIKTTFKGISFKFKIQDSRFKTLENEDYEIKSPLIGIINVYNILSSIGAALSMNISFETIKDGIAAADLVKGRFEKVDMGQKFLAIVDYAHTEDALERLLITAKELLNEKKRGKIITVFGCGGNRDKGKRPAMGEIATRLSDFVIITSDNPRNEDPMEIVRDIEKGIKNKDNYIVISDRTVAINIAVEKASKGDIVLIAGKGHEDYQEIQGKRYNFSDKVSLENAIRQAANRLPSKDKAKHKDKETATC